MKTKIIILFACLFLHYGYSQTNELTGKVSDQSGPLPGVSVIVKGTDRGAATDFDGAFSLLTELGDTLLFSYIGYHTKEIVINNFDPLQVVMMEDVEVLDDVVVSILGFNEDRDEIASTYAKINPDEIVESGEPTLLNGLAGKASGVTISASTSDPGAGSNIQIRGASSIIGQTTPLFVIDGIPVNNDNIQGFGSSADGGVSQQSRINDLNPDDIESLNVYKGASAGVVYGSKGIGGVIVITTKKGKKGKLRATLSSTYSIDEINRKHPLQTGFGQGAGGTYSPTAANSWGDRIADRPGGEDIFNTSGQYFEAQDGTIHYPILTKNSRETFVDKNFDEIFRTGNTRNIRFNVSGGNENNTYYFSTNRIEQDGIMRNSFYKKTSFTLGTTFKFNDWLSTSPKVTYSHNTSNRIQQGSNSAGVYLGLLRTPPDFDASDYIGTYYDADGNPTPLRHRSYRRYLGNTDSAITNNPLWTIYEQSSETEVDKLLASTDFNIKANDWLNFVIRGGIDQYTDNRDYLFPVYSSDGAQTGRYENELIKFSQINAEMISMMNFNITDNLNTEITLGAALNDEETKQVYVQATDFLYNARLKNQSIAENILSRQVNTKFRNVRFYGLVQFNFNELLNLNGGLTYEDASSSSKSYLYKSGELGFNWSELLESESSNILSFGKLRLTYGEVGLPGNPYKFNTIYQTASYSGFSDAVTLEAFGGGFQLGSELGNPFLEFEKKKEYEAGVDLRLFRNKLSLSGTYYYNKTEDALLELALNPSQGFDELYANAATLENKGFEIDMDYTIVKNDNLSVNIYANFFSNRNKVLEMENVESVDLTPGSSINSAATAGQPIGVFMGSGALRNEDGSLALDENGFPQLDTSGDKIIGDPNPDWRGAAGLRARYKNLEFDVLFDTSQGNDFAERTRFVLYGFGTHADTGNEVTLSQNMVNHAGNIIPAGTTVRGNIQDFGAGPVLLDEEWYTSIGGGLGSNVINEFAIGDGSWVRLRKIGLTYSLSGSDFKKTGLESIQFSLSARNLALWTKIKGIDPDINQFGVGNGKGLDYFTNPSSKSIFFGITINY